MPNSDAERIAALAAELAAVKEDVHEIKGDVREMRDVMMMGNGIWKVAAIIGGVFLIVLGGVVSHVVSLIWTR